MPALCAAQAEKQHDTDLMPMAAQTPKGSLTLRRQRMPATAEEKGITVSHSSAARPCPTQFAETHTFTYLGLPTTSSHIDLPKILSLKHMDAMVIKMQMASLSQGSGGKHRRVHGKWRRQEASPTGLAEAVTEGDLLSRGLSDGLADPEHGIAHP